MVFGGSIFSEEMHVKEWDGKNYHHYSHIQYQLAQDLLKHCSFIGDEKILDIGCGDGKITKEIATQVLEGSVLGVDYSESMITFAKGAYPPKIYKNLRFEVKDAATLSYQQEFDIVFSFCCLHWVKDQLAALQNIYSSLKPNGLFFAVIPCAIHLDRAVDATIQKEQWKSYYEGYVHPTRNYELVEYDQLLLSANFPSNSVRMHETTMVFDGRAELYMWLQQLLPHLHYIPRDSHELFLHQVIDTLLLQLPHMQQPSGTLHIPLPVLRVATKKCT
jgi:trans-aconitate 2-methyltransferase